MPFAVRPAVFATILGRAITRRIRPYHEGLPMDVCAQWTSRRWPGQGLASVYMRRGLLHVTLCGHEGVRPVAVRGIKAAVKMRPKSYREGLLKACAVNGIFYSGFKYTRRISIFFFTFCLSIEWCWKTSIEKVDVMEVGRNS